jgi:UDP-N-acetylmuramate dehydrogenase
MPGTEETLRRLAEIPNLHVSAGTLLAPRTRLGIGGPADIYAETARVESVVDAVRLIKAAGLDYAVIGSGTNLIVSDEGFRGAVLRFTASRILEDSSRIRVEAGAELQTLMDFAIGRGLQGLETLAGIPGSVGGAIHGNAGAYGHSVCELVREVHFFDGHRLRIFENQECEFGYRESIFKRHANWIIFSADLALKTAEAQELRRRADQILDVRNRKFPPTLKCAGSIFKNLVFAELPPAVAGLVPPEAIREGKVPAAYFLEQTGAKGMAKGDIRVADYHANLMYNAGAGTARDLCALIGELRQRVRERFGLELEEEVQYLGFKESGVRSQESGELR